MIWTNNEIQASEKCIPDRSMFVLYTHLYHYIHCTEFKKINGRYLTLCTPRMCDYKEEREWKKGRSHTKDRQISTSPVNTDSFFFFFFFHTGHFTIIYTVYKLKCCWLTSLFCQAECPESEIQACPLKCTNVWPVKSVRKMVQAPFLKTYQTLTDVQAILKVHCSKWLSLSLWNVMLYQQHWKSCLG